MPFMVFTRCSLMFHYVLPFIIFHHYSHVLITSTCLFIHHLPYFPLFFIFILAIFLCCHNFHHFSLSTSFFIICTVFHDFSCSSCFTTFQYLSLFPCFLIISTKVFLMLVKFVFDALGVCFLMLIKFFDHSPSFLLLSCAAKSHFFTVPCGCRLAAGLENCFARL